METRQSLTFMGWQDGSRLILHDQTFAVRFNYVFDRQQ
jgi:hypothetical protein